jgi:carboxymethylenebutenolidase
MSEAADFEQDAHVAYLATPIVTGSRRGPWPGVVVVHDAFGMGDDMREQADWLAAAGYLAVVPDLYAGRAAVRCVKSMLAQLSAQEGPAFDQIASVQSRLAGLPDCTGTVGVIGYCMGGGFALLLAGRPGWSASSVNYGTVPENVAEILVGACPVVASFGGRDRGLRGAADSLRHAAQAAGAHADVKEYPRAGHGFINRMTVPWPLPAMLKVMGVGYSHAAAADAKRRILKFFDTHLREALPTLDDPSASPQANGAT